MAKTNRGVGVYIFNDDDSRLLLTQRGPKARHQQFKWEGPGGMLEPNETYEQAAHREIAEELGIRVMIGEILGEFSHLIDSNGDKWEARIYRGHSNETPKIMEPDKCIGFGWFTRDEVARLPLADYVVKDMQVMGWLPK